MHYSMRPPTLITYKTCFWRETAATDHMVFTALTSLALQTTRCFFLKLNYLVPYHIASQCDLLTTMLLRREFSYLKCVLRAFSSLNLSTKSNCLVAFYSSQMIWFYIGIQVNQCACPVPGIHVEPSKQSARTFLPQACTSHPPWRVVFQVVSCCLSLEPWTSLLSLPIQGHNFADFFQRDWHLSYQSLEFCWKSNLPRL